MRILFGFLLLISLSNLAWARPEYHLIAELGSELDTNANRIQEDPARTGQVENPVAAMLLRMFAKGESRLRFKQQLLTIGYSGGTKIFAADQARSADELVHQANVGWARRLDSMGDISLSASYYDAFQRESQRDFRTGDASLRMILGLDPSAVRAAFHLGYRILQYKPDEDYTFYGMTGGVWLGKTFAAGSAESPVDWTLSLAYGVSERRFIGPLFGPEICRGLTDEFRPICSYPKEGLREDSNHMIRAEINYSGQAEATLGYTCEANQSNSYGESFVRQIIELQFTAKLILNFFLTAKAVIMLNRFQDFLMSELRSQTLITIEDENRSRLVMQLARELTDRWTLYLRYSLYMNESVINASSSQASLIAGQESSGPAFLRQTLFAGIRFELGR